MEKCRQDPSSISLFSYLTLRINAPVNALLKRWLRLAPILIGKKK